VAVKVFCCATAFAAVAHRIGDTELKQAALGTLQHFSGDVVYTAGGEGTSGYLVGGEARNVLKGHDETTLRIVGGSWAEITSS